MIIKAIKNANVKGYLKLGIDTGEGLAWLLVSEGQYNGLGAPAVNQEIDEDVFRLLSAFEEYNRAKKKALNILAFGDNSKKALITKLSRAGISRAVAERVLAELEERGYINEERQLLRIIENEVNLNLHGARKIIARLYPKGYSVQQIKSAIHTLEREGKIDFLKTKEKLLDGVADEEEKRKILYKKGF